MHRPNYAQLNETHEILWDFEKYSDHPTPYRRADIMLIKKKITYHLKDFAASVYQRTF